MSEEPAAGDSRSRGGAVHAPGVPAGYEQESVRGRSRLLRFIGNWEVVELGEFVRIRDHKISPNEARPDTHVSSLSKSATVTGDW